MDWRSDYRMRLNWNERFTSIRNSKPEIDKELIQDCLRYVFGFKKNNNFNKYYYRNADFPECLTKPSNEKEKKILEEINSCKSLSEIADVTKLSKKTVVYNCRQYEKSLKFYAKWKVFWEFIEPVRKEKVSEMLKAFHPTSYFSRLEKRGVVTIEDYIKVSTEHKNEEKRKILGKLKQEDMERIYECIFHVCCSLLNEDKSND
jgi:predicted DNA-binding protein YlxM (UPF0122 family)